MLNNNYSSPLVSSQDGGGGGDGGGPLLLPPPDELGLPLAVDAGAAADEPAVVVELGVEAGQGGQQGQDVLGRGRAHARVVGGPGLETSRRSALLAAKSSTLRLRDAALGKVVEGKFAQP